MCEEYQHLHCKKCGLSSHYPVKNPNLSKPPDWHCSLCGSKQPQNRKTKPKEKRHDNNA